jgi:hypothetical protein
MMFIFLNSYNSYNYKNKNYFTIKARVVVLHGLAKANGLHWQRLRARSNHKKTSGGMFPIVKGASH